MGIGSQRGSLRVGLALASVLAGAAGLAGCATATSGSSAVADNAAPGVGNGSPSGLYCGELDAAPPTGQPARAPLPADMTPVSASRCVVTYETVPGEGEFEMRVHQRATTGLEPLVQALRLPSQQPGRNVACDAVGYAPIDIVLTDSAGNSITAAVPTEMCGAPRREVVAAILATPWQTVGKDRGRQTRSQLEIDSGCPGRYKPVVAIQADFGINHPPAGPAFPSPPASLQLCRYTLDRTDTIRAGNGPDRYTGQLASATTLTGDRLATVLSTVDNAPAAVPCDLPQPPFALLMPKLGNGGPTVAIELGGCDRAVDDAGALRQLTPAFVATLTA